MALTFAQRRDAVKKGLRVARQSYRKADSAGERLERELDRLIQRKTFVTPEQLQKMAQLYIDYGGLVNDIQRYIASAIQISQQQL